MRRKTLSFAALRARSRCCRTANRCRAASLQFAVGGVGVLQRVEALAFHHKPGVPGESGTAEQHDSIIMPISLHLR